MLDEYTLWALLRLPLQLQSPLTAALQREFPTNSLLPPIIPSLALQAVSLGVSNYADSCGESVAWDCSDEDDVSGDDAEKSFQLRKIPKRKHWQIKYLYII